MFGGAVEVGRGSAEVVAVGDADMLGEIALGDMAQPGADLAERADQRPRDRPAEQQRNAMAPTAKPITTRRDARYAAPLSSMPDTTSDSALLTSWLVSRSRLSASGCASAIWARMSLRGTANADQLDQPRHHRDKFLVILAHARKQLDLVAGDELQPLQVVAELVQLAQRAVERPLVGGEQRSGDMVELAGGIELHLAIGRDFAFQLDQLGGAGR